MVQYPRHAVVEFHPDWAIKSWHCVLCGSQCDSQEQLKSHLQFHEIKDVIATVITTGNLQNGAAINFKHSFITDSTADVSISTGDVAAHVKKEINDSDDYMPLEEVESDNESFGAKLEPNDDDSEIPEFKIEAVHSDDNEMETSFTYDENANSPEEAIKFNCKYCDKSFDTKPKLERHQKLNHEVLVCPVRNCTQKLVDVNHIMKHSTISPRFKSQRVAQTATKTSLSAGQSSQDEKSSVPVLPPGDNMEINEGVEGRFLTIDEECDKMNISANVEGMTTSTQASEVQNKVVQLFKCKHSGCEYQTRFSSNISRHRLYHRGQKNFRCNSCTRTYYSRYELKRHELGHKYDRFICDQCCRLFVSEQSLKVHVKVNHKKVGYTCNVCNQVMVNKADFTGHMNHHLNMKPFKCSDCNKAFMYKKSLARHMKEKCQTQDKDIMCDQCLKTFKTIRNLKEHQEAKHTDKKFRCSCGRQYSWRSAFQRHKRQCH